MRKTIKIKINSRLQNIKLKKLRKLTLRLDTQEV